MRPAGTLLGAADPIDRDGARELARRELEKAAYHRDDPSWLDRMWERFTEWIDQILNRIANPGEGSGGGWISVIIIIVVVIVAVALVIWVMRRRGSAGSGRDGLLEGLTATAREHRSEAERLAAAGMWAEAIRERLRSIARNLEERVIIAPRPGRTADELAAEAGAELPDHAAELAGCVRIFDDVWYGDRPGTPDGYERITALDEALRSARPRAMNLAKERAGGPAGPDGGPVDDGAPTDWTGAGRRA